MSFDILFFQKIHISAIIKNIITKVDELIILMIEQLDVRLLNQISWEEDVQIIKPMPIYLEMEDVVGWHFDNKGMVWVKSACKVQRACEATGQRRRVASGAGGSIYW